MTATAAADLPPAVAAEEREAALRRWLRHADSVALGFSGGVDSSYLAYLALEVLGPAHVLAVIGRSASYPLAQWEQARTLADRLRLPVVEVDTDELADPRYAANPSDRCFFCKSELWSRVVPVAAQHGLATVVDGTNADDLRDHRPGARAAHDAGVRSPLAELGFSKSEIRARSRAFGLPTWDAPSSPCLASRLPYGTPVTTERLARVERAEAALRALGIEGDLRVRDHGDLARIELAAPVLDRWLQGSAAERVRAAVESAGYARAAIDLRGFRSGSLNVLHAGVDE